MRRALNESVCQSVRSSSAPLQLQGEAEQAMQRRRDKRMGGGGLGARPFVCCNDERRRLCRRRILSPLFSRLLLPSLPFPSSLPFSNPLPKPVVFQLFSQNQSNGTSCSTDPGLSPPGRRHGRPVFPSDGWPVLSPVIIFTRWMAGFFHRSYFSPSGWPVLSPVMSLTWWVAGFVTGDRR